MNIHIICIGKVKEAYLKAGSNEYLKRLSKYCKVNIIELEDEKTPEKPSQREIEIVQQAEASRIKATLKSGWYAIALDSEGKQYVSEELAANIDELGISGRSNIAFIIGGSLGLAKEIRDSADLLLSFSKLTFPHQLIRLFLLEQIYRSFKIIRGETYHK